jgi:hypothetical protein
MKQYFSLILDSERDDLASVIDYEIDSFDPTVFWRGQEYCCSIPAAVRLYVNDADVVSPDFLGNPLSWPIFSERLVKLSWELLKSDVKLFDAPLVSRANNQRLPGFSIVNTLRQVECLDLTKSVVSYSEEEERIVGIHKYAVIAEKVPSGLHIFRPTEWEHALIVSDEFVDSLRGKGLLGVALQNTKTV